MHSLIPYNRNYTDGNARCLPNRITGLAIIATQITASPLIVVRRSVNQSVRVLSRCIHEVKLTDSKKNASVNELHWMSLFA